MIALRSPIFSAMAPKIGWPIPQARFWSAMAKENSARAQPNSSATGIWNSPKAERIAKLRSRIAQPATSTGVMSEAREASGIMRGTGQKS
jgi:hypothetical protein